MAAEIGLNRAPTGHFQPVYAPKFRQIFRLEPQRHDHQIGLFDIIRALDQLRALPPTGIRRAQPHPLHHHAFNRVTGEPFRRGQPDEINALFFGILHLALAARHVVLVAPIQAFHAGRALPHRRAHTIHRRVAAADHHDPFALRIQLAGIEIFDRITKAFAIARGQVVNCPHDAFGPHTRRLQIP